MSFKKQQGFTLMEVLIAVFLTSIVFMGIFGGFQLATRVVSQTKIKLQAFYVASQTIETVRGLRYQDIETIQEVITLNNISYTVQTIVETYDDCFDGTIEGFDCDGIAVDVDLAPDDYKRVKVYVTWSELWGGEINLSTIAASRSMETGEGKGALKLTISTSLGVPIEISSPDQIAPCLSTHINIINSEYATDQCYGTSVATPGIRILILDESLVADDYKVIVEREGYSRTETFQAGDTYDSQIIATPLRKNPTIIEGELYPLTLPIDELADLNVYTLSPGAGDRFFDSFFNDSKIAEIDDLERVDNSIRLTSWDGYLISTEIDPGSINQWDELSFSDFTELETSINYQLYYATSVNWFLIPNIDLPGNSSGFDEFVDLSSLSVIDYPKLKIRGNLATTDLLKTPILYDYQVSYKTGNDILMSDVDFTIRGEEIVGTTGSEENIYKYQEDHITDANGHKALLNIDPDSYWFSSFSRYGQSLTLLTAMPLIITPGISTSTNLYLETGNYLLVRIKDAETDEVILGATVELTNSTLGYDDTQISNKDGDALFLFLSGSANYHLEILAEDYQDQDYNLEIWSSTNEFVNLERYE